MDWLAFGADAPADAFNHLILDAEGRGHVVGISYYVDCPTPMRIATEEKKKQTKELAARMKRKKS